MDSYDLLRVYARCGTFKDSARFLEVSRDAFSQKWYQVGLPSPKSKRTNLSEDPNLPYYEVAVISDMHWGSIYQQKTFFDQFIEDCKERNIQTLICCGDIIDGIMAQPFHEEKRFLHTTSDFERYVYDNYPNGFKNSYLINGNHEKSLSKFDWHYNFGKELSIRRTDLTYIDPGTSVVGPGNIIFSISHGGGSCAAPGQVRNKRLRNKTLQLMSEGNVGHIFLSGHCHSVAYIPSYMNTIIIGLGCFQAPNEHILRSFGKADVCGLVLGYQVNEYGQPVNLNVDFRFINDYGGIIENDY